MKTALGLVVVVLVSGCSELRAESPEVGYGQTIEEVTEILGDGCWRSGGNKHWHNTVFYCGTREGDARIYTPESCVPGCRNWFKFHFVYGVLQVSEWGDNGERGDYWWPYPL